MEQPKDGVETIVRWTPEKFNSRFDEILQANRFENPDFPYTQAYQIVEEEHVKLFGKVRFSSYDSFRHIRRNIIFP